MQISKTLYLFIFGILCLTMTLWAGSVAADAGYSYDSGWLSRDYNAPLDEVMQASEEVLDFNDMRIVTEDKAADSVLVKAEVVKTHDNTCWIKLESKGDNLTTISIYKAYLDSPSLTRKILRQIDVKL